MYNTETSALLVRSEIQHRPDLCRGIRREAACTLHVLEINTVHTPGQYHSRVKVDQSDVVTWFKEAKIKKRSKKVVTCNVQFPPPLSFIHVPFEVLRVIINDAFCESPHATIHSAPRATITGAHVVEVFGEKDAWRVWDQAPSGTSEKVGTPPPTVRFSEKTSNLRTLRTVSCGALSFFWPQPPNLLPRAHQSGSDLPS